MTRPSHWLLSLLLLILAVPAIAQERRGESEGDRGRFERGRFDRGRFDRGRGDGGQGEIREGGREAARSRMRSGWNPTDYITRLDRDKNGVLDSTEISGRTRGYIERMGFDPSNPVPLKAVLAKVDVEMKRRAEDQRRQELDANRKVAGFGEEYEWPPVADFSVDGSDVIVAGGSLRSRYTNGVVEQVEMTLRRYDRNGDRTLDESENRRARLPRTADANRDNNLSQIELAEYYKARDAESQARAKMVQATTVVSRNVNRSSSESRRTPPSASNYVNTLFGKYDTNADGKLDKKEMESCSVPFKDANGDGDISRDEAMAYVSGGTSSNTTSTRPSSRYDPRGSSSGGSTDSTAVRRDLSGFGRVHGQRDHRDAESSQDSGSSSEFRNLDKNRDGQIQMSEFSQPDAWTDAKLKEFMSRDANGDGVITSAEWSKRR